MMLVSKSETKHQCLPVFSLILYFLPKVCKLYFVGAHNYLITIPQLTNSDVHMVWAP